MIIVKMCGGLGNQLFQYAMAKSLALRNCTSVKLDLAWFSKYSATAKRQFMLDAFNVEYSLADKHEIKSCKLPRKLLGKGIYENLLPFSMKPYVKFKPFHGFDGRCLNIKAARRTVYLEGFWTDERYFLEHADVLRSEYTLRNSMSYQNRKYLQMIENTESVSLHVRRGDYVNNADFASIFDICHKEYYQSAIEIIGNSVKEPVFFVFSDDITWAKENITLRGKALYISDEQGSLPHEELVLMSSCKHNIIANSTFSWWGAWLNVNKNKKVIAPDTWFNLENNTGASIVPLAWETLRNKRGQATFLKGEAKWT
jgi:hypothetical protein